MASSIIDTSDNTENNIDNSSFPPMTEFEKICVLEWGKNDDSDLNVVTLYDILKRHVNNAEGHSYTDRIKNLSETLEKAAETVAPVDVIVGLLPTVGSCE